MERRHVLRFAAVGVAAFAGCSSDPESQSTPASNNETPTSSTPGDSDPPENDTETTSEEEESTSDDPDATYVSVEGSSGASGTRDDPLDSIYDAVRDAEPGETIHVAAGEYREEIHTQGGGNPGEPITITGPRDAVVRPTLEDGRARQGAILNINHSHVHLRGLTFDGLANPAREGEADWYGEVINAKPEEGQDYLEDLVIMPDAVGNSRKALVSTTRIVDAEIGGFEVTGPAGVRHLYGDEDGHNGEIVYLGTAIDNIPTGGYPWETVDETRDVHVHHIDNSAGHPHAELVDAKHGTRDILIEYCTDLGGSASYVLPGHDDTDEAAVSLGGRNITLRYTVIEDGNGQAVQVGPWNTPRPDQFEEEVGIEYPEKALEGGKQNAIYHNRFTGNAGLAIRFPLDGDGIIPEYGPDAQRHICGNTYDGDTHGRPDRSCGDVPQGDGIGHTGGDSPWE